MSGPGSASGMCWGCGGWQGLCPHHRAVPLAQVGTRCLAIGNLEREQILGAFAELDNNVASELHPKHATKLKKFFFPFNLKVTVGKSLLASAVISPQAAFLEKSLILIVTLCGV